MKSCIYIIISLSLILLNSCEKSEPTMDYSPCWKEEHPTPDELFNLLQGKWQLTKKSCDDCATSGFTQLKENNYFLTFRSDSTLQIRNNTGTILYEKFIISSSYSYPPIYFVSVQNSTTNTYGIEGIVSICNNKLVFSSYGSNQPTYIYTKQPN